MYRHQATSIEGFVQQTVLYLANGYWFFVRGRIPAGKSPEAVDEKLISKYGVNVSKWARARRKRQGVANVHYLRFESDWLLIATHGRHAFFEEEAKSVRDARRTPIRFAGYALSYRRGADGKHHAHVRIDREYYNDLKAYFLDMAPHRSAERLVREFWNVPFEPYAPVRRQYLNILRAVNRARKEAGFARLPMSVIPYKRRIVKPFECLEEESEAA